jgi:glycosyltransferase involved in cell wall biosynthesis
MSTTASLLQENPLSTLETAVPLISVIIPVYNREDYIERALDSILEESYPNKNIVLIDDGSTDNTHSVITGWIERNKDKISVTYRSRSNLGFVKTLNELIDLASGSHIVFFGSDDVLKNDGIQKRYDYLHSHPDKLMVLGDCQLIDGQDKVLHQSAFVSIGKVNKALLKTDEGTRKFMILNGYTPGATLMADKRIYSILGKYDERFGTEDWVYYIRAVAKNMLGFMDETVAAYRVHENNACYSSKIIKTEMEHFQVALSVWPEFPSPKEKVYLILKYAYLTKIIAYLKLKFYFEDTLKTNQHSRIHQLLFKALLTLKTLYNSSLGLVYKH